MSNLTRILLIEDDEKHYNDATEELLRKRNDEIGAFIRAESLSDFEKLFGDGGHNQYDAVLTDLFFPAGDMDAAPLVQRFLPHYESYKAKRFPEIKDNVVLSAVENVSSLMGVGPGEYVENVLTRLNTPESVLKASRDAVAGIQDSERYERFLEIEKGVRDGTNLPLGIVAAERSREMGIPCAMVTSTYHHDDEFEAVRDLVTVPYVDTLVDGKKQWGKSLDLVMSQIGGRE